MHTFYNDNLCIVSQTMHNYVHIKAIAQASLSWEQSSLICAGRPAMAEAIIIIIYCGHTIHVSMDDRAKGRDI